MTGSIKKRGFKVWAPDHYPMQTWLSRNMDVTLHRAVYRGEQGWTIAIPPILPDPASPILCWKSSLQNYHGHSSPMQAVSKDGGGPRRQGEMLNVHQPVPWASVWG